MKKVVLLAILLVTGAAGLSACVTTESYRSTDPELERALRPKD